MEIINAKIEHEKKLHPDWVNNNSKQPFISGDLLESITKVEIQGFDKIPADINLELDPKIIEARLKIDWAIANAEDSPNLVWDEVEEISAAISKKKRYLTSIVAEMILAT